MVSALSKGCRFCTRRQGTGAAFSGQYWYLHHVSSLTPIGDLLWPDHSLEAPP